MKRSLGTSGGRHVGTGYRAVSILVSLMLAASLLSVPAYSAASDVPTNHWAYEAVSTLVSRGYLSVYDDGTFRGDQPVDRFTFAAAIHQLLREMETGITTVDEADVALLRQLSTEFREELVAFYQLREELIASVQSSERRVAIFDESLSRVIDAVAALEAATADLRELQAIDTEGLRQALALESEALRQALAGEREALREEFAKEAEALRQEFAEETEALRQEFAQRTEALHQGMASENAAQDLALEELHRTMTERLNVLSEYVSELEYDVDSVWEEALALRERVGELEEADERIEGDIGTLRADVAQLQAGLEERAAALEAALEEQRIEQQQQLAALRASVDAMMEEEGANFLQRLEEVNRLLEGGLGTIAADLADVQSRLAEAEATLFLLDERFNRESAETREAIAFLMDETESLMETSDSLLTEIDALRGQLQELDGALLEVQTNLERQGQALLGGQGQLMADLRALRDQLDALERRLAATENRVATVDHIREEMSALADRLGLTEHERDQLIASIRDDMGAQLNLSLMREQRLQRDLEELRKEFDSFKASKEEEVSSLRGTTTIAIAVGVLGLILGLSR